MNKNKSKNSLWIILLLIVVIAASCFCAYRIGKNQSASSQAADSAQVQEETAKRQEELAKAQEETAKAKEETAKVQDELAKAQEQLTEFEKLYKEELELVAALNRSELDGLGKIEGPIYVTGHKNPDTDTIGSSIAYAELLQQLGYDARAIVLGDINRETELVLERAGLEEPEKMEDVSGCNMVLMDHSELAQSADGLQDANILTIIDHHGVGSVTTGKPLIYDARPLGSTATIVYIRYYNYGLTPSKQAAVAMLGAILSDTHNLVPSATTEADRIAVEALSELAGVEDVDAFYQEMFKALISYDGMTDEEIFFHDYKEYEVGGKKYGIGCIDVYDEAEAREMAARMKDVVANSLSSSGADMAFAQISVFHDDLSLAYLLPSDEAADEVLQTAFGDRAERDGDAYVLKPGISRKKVLAPAISDILEASPKE